MYGAIGLYAFSATIDPKVGVSSLFVNYAPKLATIAADNGGTGSFPVQDKVIFHAPLSCASGLFTEITVAVSSSRYSHCHFDTHSLSQIRNNAGLVSSPFVDFSFYTDLKNNGVTVKKVKTLRLPLLPVPIIRSPSSVYSLYSTIAPVGRAASFTAYATVGGKPSSLTVDLVRDVTLAKC